MRIFLLSLSMMMSVLVFGQELKIDVKISTPTLNLSDPKVIQDMKKSITEFYNNNKWTDDEYKDHERIEGSLLITVKSEVAVNVFVADFTFQTIRPVYNSTYTTKNFYHIDKDITFKYEEFQRVENSKSSFIDNLSSILTFYAYVMLATDYDSFSPFGGGEHIETAQSVISEVPSSVSSTDREWTPQGSRRSRYQLIQDLLNPNIRSFRQAYYEYHRLSLDIMADDAARGKAIMLSALSAIEKANQTYPNSIVMRNFASAKTEEIVEIFKVTNRGEKKRVHGILAALDPANADKYAILKR